MGLRAEPSPWRSRDFRVFSTGNVLNNIGEAMYAFALPLLALSYTGSLATMALLIAVTPFVLTAAGPVLGHVADRYGSRVLVVPGLLLQLAAALALNLALLSGPVPVWALYLAEILVQVGAVSYRAGWFAGIPAMFPDRPGRARGTLTTLFQSTLIVGPALAALLVGPLGYEGLLWLNSATFLAPLAVWFAGVNPVRNQRAARGEPKRLLASLREGAALFAKGGKMGTLVAVLAPACFTFSTATTTLFVFVAITEHHASPATVGTALAVANIGGVVGALLTSEIPRWSLRPLTLLTLVVVPLCLATVSFAPGLILATAGLVVFYLTENVVMVAAEMEMFASVPAHMIGRATGFWRLMLGLPTLLAPLVVAAVDAYLSARTLLLLLGAVVCVPLLWLLTHRAALRPEPEEAVTG